jgi:hypothetical protein
MSKHDMTQLFIGMLFVRAMHPIGAFVTAIIWCIVEWIAA